MKFTVTSLIVVLLFLARGMALNSTYTVNRINSTRKYYRIPYGMAEFGPFRGRGINLSLEMPLSKNLTQIERLSLSEKCLPFRQKCTMAEECCSMKCLVHILRCNA